MQNKSRKQKKNTVVTTVSSTVEPVVSQVTPTTTPSRRRRNRRRNRNRRLYRRAGPGLSACAMHYLKGISNPFYFLDNMDMELPCIPIMPVRRTQKVLQYAKGSIAIGASGLGYIMMTPEVAHNDSFIPGAAVYPTLWHNASNYIGNAGSVGPGGFDWVGAVNAGPVATGTGVNLNGPFLSTAFAPSDQVDGIRYRVVGMGIRVRYVGTLLNRSGNFFTLENPSHSDLQVTDLPTVRSYDQSRSFAMTDRWVYVTYRPSKSTELDFRMNKNLALLYSTGVGLAPANLGSSPDYVIGICFSGLQNGSSIEYEAVQIVEYIGTNARSATSTVADSVGMDAVLSATANGGSGSVDHSPAAEKGLVQKTLEHLAQQSGQAVQTLTSAAVSAATAVGVRKLQKLSGYDLVDTPPAYTIEYPY